MYLVSCLLSSLSDSVALHGLEWLGMVWACASRLWAPGARFRHFGHFGQGGAPNITIVFFYFMCILFLGIFEHFWALSNTPLVANAGKARTGRNAIGLAQNPGQFAASPKRFFLLPPCGPLSWPRLPLAWSGLWGRPLLFSFCFPSPFSSPPPS